MWNRDGQCVMRDLANSPLVGQIAFKQSGTTCMTTTKQYDYLNRLTSISSAPSGTGVAPVPFSYTYNSANHRVQSALVDGSYWSYNYDSLGQVTSGIKYWAGGTPVAGQQFGYGFDDIGNRTTTAAGGDQYGANLRYASYTANNWNQYTSRTVPRYVNVIGTANSNATVTVNDQSTYRKGNYFRGEPALDNSAAAVYASLTNLAVLNNGTNADIVTTNIGKVFLPQTPETFGYDMDGNLTNDGRWFFGWDAENRLTNMTSLSTAPSGSLLKLDFAYDYKSRRIQKIVSTNSGSAYIAQSTNKSLYDGWNLVAELSPNGSLIRSYVWGLDLSGTMQGAGGVGGLLETTYYGSSTTNCFAAYDGNGNVAALVNAADGTTVASYEYGPFGELLRVTGPMAKVNAFRFSTKYQDDETDLLYYGYRYYNPSMGRWLSRDPIGEFGFDPTATNQRRLREIEKSQTRLRIMAILQGEQPANFLYRRSMMNSISLAGSREDWLREESNLYAFVENDPANHIDPTGLYVDGAVVPGLDGSLHICAVWGPPNCGLKGFHLGKLMFCVGVAHARLLATGTRGDVTGFHNACVLLDDCYKNWGI